MKVLTNERIKEINESYTKSKEYRTPTREHFMNYINKTMLELSNDNLAELYAYAMSLWMEGWQMQEQDDTKASYKSSDELNAIEATRIAKGISVQDITNTLGFSEENYRIIQEDLDSANVYQVQKVCNFLGMNINEIW